MWDKGILILVIGIFEELEAQKGEEEEVFFLEDEVELLS